MLFLLISRENRTIMYSLHLNSRWISNYHRRRSSMNEHSLHQSSAEAGTTTKQENQKLKEKSESQR